MLKSLLRRGLAIRKPGILFAGHGVADRFFDRHVEEVHISSDQFRSIIDLLIELGFDFVSLDQLTAIQRDNWKHGRPWVHLSFDDGYANNLFHALPILEERQIPFTVFVSTHHIETGDRFPTFWLRFAEWCKISFSSIFTAEELQGAETSLEVFERLFRFASVGSVMERIQRVKAEISPAMMENLKYFENDRPMRPDELITLSSSPYVNIGSHSYHHITYTDSLDLDLGKDQLIISHRFVSKYAEYHPVTFCYPNGDWTEHWKSQVEELGYDLGFGSHGRFIDSETDKFLLPRFWLSNARRTAVICWLSLFGNKGLRTIGR